MNSLLAIPPTRGAARRIEAARRRATDARRRATQNPTPTNLERAEQLEAGVQRMENQA